MGLRSQTLTMWAQSQVITQHSVHAVSGTQVLHPQQFTGVPPASTRQPALAPLGHQIAAPPTPLRRALTEYDQMCGVVASEVAA